MGLHHELNSADGTLHGQKHGRHPTLHAKTKSRSALAGNSTHRIDGQAVVLQVAPLLVQRMSGLVDGACACGVVVVWAECSMA